MNYCLANNIIETLKQLTLTAELTIASLRLEIQNLQIEEANRVQKRTDAEVRRIMNEDKEYIDEAIRLRKEDTGNV